MTDRPDPGQSSSVEKAAEFPFSRVPPLAPTGPATVVNPERRGSSSPHPLALSRPESSVVNRLFPPELIAEDEPTVPGPEGFELGHFRIEERIGTGGMGAVFRAVDLRLNRAVALKVLSPAHSRDDSSVERFRNEARAAAQLDHDNIARVFYIGEDKGLHFIAFEYIKGTNVRDLIRDAGRLQPAEAVNYALQIAVALKHTAAAGVVHRDIKPSNIIITPTGRAKLVDLGLARKQFPDLSGDLTLAGTTLGTFDYISPEQAKDPRKVDVRSDIYSLGCTLYHMLTDEPPYPEGTVLQKLLDHQGKDPPDPASRNRAVSPALSAVVQKMMASEPKRRYATPDELIRDLMLIAGHLGLRGINPEGLIWAASQYGKLRFWERHLGWMATAGLLLVIVFLLDWFPGLGPNQPPDPAASVVGDDGSSNPDDVSDGKNEPDEGRADLRTTGVELLKPATNDPPREDGSGDQADERKVVAKVSSERGKAGTARRDEGAGMGTIGSVAGEAPWFGPRRVVGPDAPRKLFDSGDADVNPLTVGRGDPDSDQETRQEPPESKGGKPESTSPAKDKPERSSKTKDADEDPPSPPIVAKTGAEPAVPPPPPIAVLVDGVRKKFDTLEAACHAAEDGGIIELSFNGRRFDEDGKPLFSKPVKVVNKKLTIRAAEGFRPLIEFSSAGAATVSEPNRVTVIGAARVEFINVDLAFHIEPYDFPTKDRWVLFSLQGSGQIHLKTVNVTLANPGEQPAAVFELTGDQSIDAARMKMMTMGQPTVPEPFGVKLDESFVRGGGDLFVTRHTRPGRLEIGSSAIAVEGTLLASLGNTTDERPPESAQIDLVLDHVTCLVGNGVIRMDSGRESPPRYLLRVRVSASNNLFAAKLQSPLVTMEGGTEMRDFQKMLAWEGGPNFYDGFQMFWTITPSQMSAGPDRIDFDAWTRKWGAAGAHNGRIVWKGSPLKSEFAGITRRDLELVADVDPARNPAATGATDGGPAGADLSKLADFARERSASDGLPSP